MIAVTVDNQRFEFPGSRESDLIHALQARRGDAREPCVVITVHVGGTKLTLPGGGCPRSLGAGGSPTGQAAEVAELWRDKGLDGTAYPPGALISFIKQLGQLGL